MDKSKNIILPRTDSTNIRLRGAKYYNPLQRFFQIVAQLDR